MAKTIPSIMDYQMPDTREYEHRIINSILADPSNLMEIISIIKREMFSNEHTQKMWDTIVKMYYNHELLDIVTFMPKVDRTYFVENILSADSVYGCIDLISLAIAFLDTYTKRMAYITSVEVLQQIQGGISSDDIMEKFDSFSKNVTEGIGDASTKRATDVANALADELQSNMASRVPTLIPTLDSYTYGGFGGGNLVILAARPSVGKTTIAMQIAQASSGRGLQTLVFSLEMTAKELVQRQILSTGLITPYEIFSHNINWENYERAVAQVVNPDLVINDSSCNINDIRQKIIIACQEGKCKAVMIDYLQLIKGANPRNPMAQQIAEYTSILKQTAKQCNIPIILLSQLNRSSVSENRSPQLYDLRDSGAIEQDADVVIMLERAKDDMGGILDNTIDMWIRKNRAGKCNFDNPIRLKGNETYSNFTEQSQNGEY